jgi:hypothetical protein
MKHLLRFARLLGGVCVALTLLASALPANAGTTGTIAGRVTDATTGAPIAGVVVTAASPSQTESTKTNAAGFYSLQALTPETYTVSFQSAGYNAGSQPGATVQQDFVYRLDMKLTKELKTIATATARGAGNLVKPYSGTDVYNVSGAQLNAATGGDNLHRTIYEYLNTVPGVTPIGGGYPAEPSIRGGYDVDNGYELDGIPITERMTGYFTTNLTDLGIGNVEVYTGGLSAQNAGNGVGVINSVIKTGTYPAFGSFSAGITSPDFNHLFRAEYGNASPDRKFSYYLAVDSANSQNDFNYGQVAFNLNQVGISSGNPGYIETRDVIANFHYRPNQNDDIQFLYQNSLYNEGVNYALYSGTSSAPLLMLQPCPGAQPSSTTYSGGQGGTAPNGQTCSDGLYFAALGNGDGNFLGHYSGIGKIQWNHVINSQSSFALRLAENFNQYIFDQKLSDPNVTGNNASPGTNIDSGCPQYPYAAGTPLVESNGSECTQDLGDYYQNRYGNDYYLTFDYTNTPTENLTFKAGAGQEYDNQKRDVRYLNLFNADATSSYLAALTDIPMHVPYVYAQASMNLGKFTIEPGLRYSRAYYGIPAEPQLTSTVQPNGVPGGSVSVGFLAPSLLGTYRFGVNDVLRYSYSTTGQFIGTEFVYRYNSTTYNPFYINPDNGKSTSYQPTVNTSFDMQWEHQINPSTSLKIGPYYRFSNNYLAIWSPLINTPGNGTAPKYGDAQVTNNLKIRSFGVEAGLSHVDNRPTGASFWLSGSLNNYWTQITAFGQVAFINTPLADYFLQNKQFVRSPFVPPFAGTLVADLHTNGFHVIPEAYYTFGNFYRTGACADIKHQVPINEYTQPVSCKGSSGTNGQTQPPEMLPELQGMGYWKVNLTVAKDLSTRYTVGVRISNLTNNEHDWTGATIPCWNPQDPNLPTGQGSGCFGLSGPQSGTVAPVGYIYQNLTTDPRRYEFFMNYKF